MQTPTNRTPIGLNRFLTALLLAITFHVAETAERPNIILIMVDDMGFADLGYHGSEIETPNINSLAHGGIRFSQFYNSGRCCPTRATLMTGLHPHQTGIGWMTQPPNSNRGANQPPAYQGYLNRKCVTLGEVLKDAGYATLMSGKWHLGNNHQSRWPLQRGFEKYFGCISGATRFFLPAHPRGMTLGNENIEKPESTTDEAFYTTDAFTDYGMRFIREHRSESTDKPFFLYLAYTAPHWPLQAFEDDIAKYRGKYRIGWDELRARRLKRQREIGLINPKWDLSKRTPSIPAWDTLDEKKQDEMDLKMAVYAAMIDRVDQNIGRLVGFLKQQRIFNDTLIMFLSDNGACQEGGMFGRGDFYDIEKRNNYSGNSYGEAWSNAGNTPFRLYKHFVHEGGASTPFFMHWPAKIKARRDWYREPGQLIDLMPTIIDVAGAKYPRQFHGNDIPALDGISMRPAFSANPLGRKEPIFVEHENNAFIRDGDWKLVGKGVSAQTGVDRSKWELYNIRTDRTETRDLRAKHPERAKRMADQWDAWARRANVYPMGTRGNSKPKSTAKEEPNPPVIRNKPFTLSATVRHKNPKGVVLSQGGVQHGFSLHFVNGRPAFSLRQQGQLTELIGEKNASGKLELTAELSRETMRIYINGDVVAERKSPGLFTAQPAIGLYKGEDFKDPVGSYKVPNKFNGKVLSYKVKVGD
ncbi:MAG: arylsulfatase [Verrucomicrobiales bacterium]|nr:arylsulfatase [Verrucomicrobiales bacterium]